VIVCWSAGCDAEGNASGDGVLPWLEGGQIRNHYLGPMVGSKANRRGVHVKRYLFIGSVLRLHEFRPIYFLESYTTLVPDGISDSRAHRHFNQDPSPGVRVRLIE